MPARGNEGPRGDTWVGTSGWHYRHWLKILYPDGLARKDWLQSYAERYRCVEVNSSFYKLPDESSIDDWYNQTDDEFRFTIKAPRLITHYKKLKNCDAEVSRFLNRIAPLGPRLGPVLFELPPRWRLNVSRLDAFLDHLPHGNRYAFEFRDPSWYCDEVYHLLRKRGAALCVYNLDGVTSPQVTTAGFMYLKLYGPRAGHSGSYRANTVERWAARSLDWNRRNRDVYVFFNNDERGHAVKNSTRFAGALEELSLMEASPIAV